MTGAKVTRAATLAVSRDSESSSRVPLIFIEVDSIASELDSLAPELASLGFVSFPWREGNSALAIDDSLPGEVMFIGRRMQDTDHLPGAKRVSCQGGDLPIGGHLAARDFLYDSYRFF